MAAWLAACAVTPNPVSPSVTPEAATAWQQHRAAIAAIKSWQLSGRLSLRGSGESFSGTLEWDEQRHATHLRFSGPFGQAIVELDEDATGARARLADGRVWMADDAAQLLAKHLGWQVPVAALRAWLKGIPVEEKALVPRYSLDGAGRLTALEQAAWQITYGNYAVVGPHFLPHKIAMKNNLVELRLVVDQWALTP